MPRPTQEELKEALEYAAHLRESDQDEHHIAKSLLNLNYRMRYMEKVLAQTKLYLNSGQAATEHSKLISLIAEAEDASRYLDGRPDDFGLE